jgi:hypothetical protein
MPMQQHVRCPPAQHSEGLDAEPAGRRGEVVLQQEACRLAAGAALPGVAPQVQGIATAGCVAMRAANAQETALGSRLAIPVAFPLELYACPPMGSNRPGKRA